ncbi:hypothetical protein GF323_01025 [Candidatus Woesearchaeota archaeon]|nr:hypothetical protein [Candidatus Woesearchaeota archaeon]
MKKRVLLIFAFLLYVPMCLGQWYLNTEETELNLKIRGEFTLEKEGNDYSAKYVKVNLSFFPASDYRQIADRIETMPEGNAEEDYVSYKWENPSLGKYAFILDSDIILKNARKEIKSRVEFPLQGLDAEKKYIHPSNTIDSDDEDIIRLANELAEGEDDLFAVVHNLATWTKNNIEYNLSTLTASVSEPASWVLDNRKGVCDEITTLFIAMCRSLGIPAKFVSGVAYTESELFEQRWGPHGWAEVYFPGYGWVEYDVTYGEFGWIDPTHIKLKEGLDPDDASTKFNWLGKNINIRTSALDIDVDIKEFDGSVEDGIEIGLSAEKGISSFGSYNAVAATMANNNDYYISEEIRLRKTKETYVEGDNARNVYFSPREERKIYWLIRVGELDKDYVYTFPISASTLRNKTAKTEFKVGYGAPSFTEKEILEIIDIEENGKKYSKDIGLSCEARKNKSYMYENNFMVCDVKNRGNVFFDNIDICFKEECKTIELGIAQEKAVEFDIREESAGRKEKLVKAIAEDAFESTIVEYNVLDRPNISIANIDYPREVQYGERYKIIIILDKESYSDAENLELTLDHEGYEQSWNIEKLRESRRFIVDMSGSDLLKGENSILVDVYYEDMLENKYNEKEIINIDLADLTLSENVLVMANMMSRRVLTYRGFIEFVILTVLIFIAILAFILRRRK